jgi:hypothetical protein
LADDVTADAAAGRAEAIEDKVFAILEESNVQTKAEPTAVGVVSMAKLNVFLAAGFAIFLLRAGLPEAALLTLPALSAVVGVFAAGVLVAWTMILR